MLSGSLNEIKAAVADVPYGRRELWPTFGSQVAVGHTGIFSLVKLWLAI